MIEQFLQNRRVILHYYIIMGVTALFISWWIRNEEGIDPNIVVVLMVYIVLYPIVILYTRKYAVHIFLFTLALITGFYSYYHYSVEAHSVLNALYFTFQLYLLVITDVFTEDGSSLLRYPWTVEIARWSAALYTISTLFIAMYRVLEMSILLIYYQIIGKHYVVFGYNKNSVALIEDLRRKNKRVILIADDLSNEAVEYLERLKVVVLHHNYVGENIYVKGQIARARAVILLHEADVTNLNEYMGIHDFFKVFEKESEELTVYIHLHEATSRKVFLDLEGTMAEHERYFKIQLINLYELFVNNLFEKYPPFKEGQSDESVHLLVIGFGALGQRITRTALIQNELSNDEMLHITAIDKAMKKIKQEWQRNYPDVIARENISLQKFDVEVDSLEEIIMSRETPLTHIYICLHEDTLDLLAAIELSNRLPLVPIYLEFIEGGIADKWIHSEVSGDRLIYGTGTFKDVLTADKLLNE